MPLKTSKPLADIYNQAVSLANQKGIALHKLKLLLADIIQTSVPVLLLDKDKELTPQQQILFNTSFQRLLNHEPIQYILGNTDFYGLTLRVNEHTLIPRPETEGLVEWIIQQNSGCSTVLDIGTGSGAIALALKYLNPAYKVTATDISPKAIQLAQTNAQGLDLDVKFEHADLFPHEPQTFDIIVSNPPYISTTDYLSLSSEVLDYEPKLALLAGSDGLAVYRRILAEAIEHLNPDGKLYLEIGESQAHAIREIAAANLLNNCELKQDLTGRDRYLCLSR